MLIKTGGQLDLNAVGLTFDGLAGGGTVTSATGTPVLTLGTANDAAISAYTVGAAAAGVASTGLNNFSGVISGSIALTKAGAGTQIIGGGTSTYSGATTINTGTLKMGAANALPSGSGKGDVTIAGNLLLTGLIVPGTLDLGGYDQAINGLNSSTGGLVVNTPTVMYTTAWGTPYGTAATTGTSTLSVGNGNASGSFNGTLQDGFSVLPVAGAGAGTGVNGLLALDKVGTGTQVLSGVNTYSGGTTIDGGTIQINSSSSLGAITGGVVINGGTLQATADITTTRNFQLGSASSTVAVDAAKTYSVSGVFSDGAGTGTLNKSGLGTLVLTGTNGYTAARIRGRHAANRHGGRHARRRDHDRHECHARDQSSDPVTITTGDRRRGELRATRRRHDHPHRREQLRRHDDDQRRHAAGRQWRHAGTLGTGAVRTTRTSA